MTPAKEIEELVGRLHAVVSQYGGDIALAECMPLFQAILVAAPRLNPNVERSLRDTFAAAALTGILASDTANKLSVDAAAEGAWEAADAMMVERGRPR